MPEEDGFAFVAAVRAQASATTVIALTAFGRSEDRVRALASDAYLKKPVDPEELAATALRLASKGE